jgi:nucleotide-binding universal stress UspA family protein
LRQINPRRLLSIIGFGHLHSVRLSKAIMIKDIVVNLSASAKRDVACDFASSVARVFGAHLTGVAFADEPVVPVSILDGLDGVPDDLAGTLRAQAKKNAQTAIARFEAAARGCQLSFESLLVAAEPAEVATRFGRIARRFDLSIVSQTEPHATVPSHPIAEAALFDSGHPVLFVPYIQREGLTLDRVMVCWDGSRSAARAMSDALPFLQRAGGIEIVTITGEKSHADDLHNAEGADIASHLARHGLTAEFKRIVAADVDVANAILTHAADSATRFIVMGGYGHSRLREFVLGGVTREIIESMTAPVLMSH